MKKYYSTLLLSLSLFFFSCGEGQENSSGNKTVKKELKTEFGIFKFDEGITGFKFATMLGDKFVYSLHGSEDIKNANPVTGFYFKPIKNIDYERAKDYLQDFSLGYGEQDGIIKTENIANKVIDVNKQKAFIITFTVVDDSNKTSYLTQAILSNGNNAILFVGSDVDNGKYSEKFLNTFKSLEL